MQTFTTQNYNRNEYFEVVDAVAIAVTDPNAEI